jgi:glycosyltransferase involved in cell wall biosynthesis
MGEITLIVHDLSSNPIARAHPLALSLKKLGYDVTVAGFLCTGNNVYEPYRDEHDYITVSLQNRNFVSYLYAAFKLYSKIDTDTIYAFKPLMTTFAIGLVYKIYNPETELYLDVEDNDLFGIKRRSELVVQRDNYQLFYIWLKRMVRNTIDFNNYFWVSKLHNYLHKADRCTVVSSKLQEKYGGDIILHGPDESLFDPTNFKQDEMRDHFGLPKEKKIILFAGTPRPHKGIDLVSKSLSEIPGCDFIFLLVGPSKYGIFESVKKTLGKQCIIRPPVPYEQMPKLLAAVDIVTIMQKPDEYSNSQIPAKLLDAMAMRKIIIATDVSDIGNILGAQEGNKRGIVINSYSKDNLKEVLLNVKDNFECSLDLGKRARKYYLKHASIAANSENFRKVFS